MSYSRPEKNPVYWYYGSASVAFGIKNNAFSYLLLIYSTQVLGVPGYLAAIALAIAMAWDAVSDLFLGHWSDKTQSSLGRRHPFMYAGFILLPLSFYALFNPLIELTDSNRWYYLLASAMLIRTAVTLFEVPSVALLPDLVKDYDERNKWLVLRHAFGWYGGNGIHVINMAFWVGAYGVAVQDGYSIYGIAGAIVIAAAILISSLGTQKAAAAMPPPAEPFRLGEIWREIRQIAQSLTNPNFLWLFIYSLFVGAAAGMSTALYLYNVTYFFEFTGAQIAITGVFVFASPAISYFLAPALGIVRCHFPLSHPLPAYACRILAGIRELGKPDDLLMFRHVRGCRVYCRRRDAGLHDGRRRGRQRGQDQSTIRGALLCCPQFRRQGRQCARHRPRRFDCLTGGYGRDSECHRYD